MVPRGGWYPALLCLWCRPVATAPIQPLAWKVTVPVGVALTKQKRLVMPSHITSGEENEAF